VSLFNLDREQERLTSAHPGWKFWYVPRASGGIEWCCQREPRLCADTPSQLEEAIVREERGGTATTLPHPARRPRTPPLTAPGETRSRSGIRAAGRE
jgi:hypothetical protein